VTRRRGTGNVEQLPSGRWRARWWGTDGRQKSSETFDSPEAAERRLARVQTDKARGTYVDPSKVRLGELFEDFLTHPHNELRESTVAYYRRQYERHIKPTFGRKMLHKLTAPAIEDWAYSVRESVGAATAHASYRILRAVLSFGVRRGHLGHNPAQALRIPGVKPRKVPRLTPQTIQAVVEAMEPRYKTMTLTMALAGLRIGEATALRVEDFDELRGDLVVNKAYAEVAGRLILGPTKTGEDGKIALPPVVVTAIKSHLEEFGPGKDGLLFAAPEGGPLPRSRFRARPWLRAIREAGVEYFPPHVLRHFAVSFALSTGAKITEAAELARHSDPSTTARVYSHSLGGAARQVAEKVSKAFEEATSGKAPESDVVPMAGTGEEGR
jgi:integrase